MKIPNIVKYKKPYKNIGFFRKKFFKVNKLKVSGDLIVVNYRNTYVTFYELESLRKKFRLFFPKIKLYLKKGVYVPLRKKSSGSRMGKGVGKIKGWCFFYRKGSKVFEFYGSFTNEILFLLNRVFKKTSFLLKFILKKNK